MATPITLMSLVTTLVENGKSFEEVRVDDYIRTYTSTGKPPVPVPQVPAADKERKALGLPLLFKPTLESDPLLGRPKESPSSSASTSKPSTSHITDPEDIPACQDFKGEKLGSDTLMTISCAEKYTSFSPEELRHYAYQKGYKYPPTELLQSITARPEFALHSFEELRVVYMLAKRELASSEIIKAMRAR